jgi:hypothetical protein
MRENNMKIYVVTGRINHDYATGLRDRIENVKAFHSYDNAKDFIEQLKLRKHRKNSPKYGGGRSYYKSTTNKESGYYSLDIEEIELV